ncbi:hypothetical protein [Micromonospora sp. NPDC050695]|uniref:hypothetical protein n=1 Tax=Micromonospora sp. NPDC050695 TaxID=3154938 RepID=UPI0033EDF53C
MEATPHPPPVVTLPAGWHWYGQVWQVTNTTAPTLRVHTAGLASGPLNIGTSSAGMSAGRFGYFATGVSGALGAITLSSTHQLPTPRIAYRRA